MGYGGTTTLIIRPQQPDWYQRLRLWIRRWTTAGGRVDPWADLLFLLPDFIHLTIQVLRDSRVRLADRALLAAVLAYVFTPFDLIPEALFGVPGLLDDLALLAAAYHAVLSRVPRALLEAYWAGPTPLFAAIRRIVEEADARLGPRRWRWLQRMVQAEQARVQAGA